MRKIFPVCCASAGQAKRKEHGAKSKDGDFSLHVFLCSLHSTLDTRPFSLDHPIRP